LIARRFAARLYSGTRETQALLSRMSTVAQENLSGMSVVHCFGREEAQVAAFARTADEYYAAQKRLIYATDGMFPFMGMLGGLATLIVLYYGGAGVIGGRLSLGEFVAFNGYLALLQWPTMAMGWILAMVQRGRASLSRISEIMAAAPTIRDDDPEAVGPIRGDIEFRGMVFDYGGRRVLDDVSLFIPAGQVLAVVGRTGAGKSTLAAMIPRLLEIPPGRLFIDGVDATRVPLAALRSAVGYAPQDPAFFSTTIADAVAFSPAADGRPESIAAVARAAGLAGDIERMPAGLGTAIGERGVKLSGGQRQRLAIARALAARPRILVLDDVFSSVDADTEARVLAGLRDHLAGRTTIIVSHRLAAARLADRVAVIDRGRLVEVGTHAELLEKGGVYAELDRAGRLAAELERMSA
jgi:ATP-binding cassette subfamily B protein